MKNLHAPKSPFAILPHENAPLFTKELVRNPLEFINVVREELESGRVSASEMFTQLIRQAGFVSLFFFLRYIASFSGPYEKLNEDLHLEMCNFRQSAACMNAGARAAQIVPRGFYKSTTCGHGADTWEALRNPNIRIRFISEIVERAHDFKNIAKATFDSNAFFALFYPEYVPAKSSSRWNETEFVLPNRTRNYSEPTISAGGATGASEGIHVDLLDIDDIHGLEDVDSQHHSNASMLQKKKWFATNTTALLNDLSSRINLRGTFYGADDVHSSIMEDAKAIEGYLDPEFATTTSGTWTVYYRSWEENGVEVFPEVMNKKRYEKLLQDDPWSAITQYGNKAHDPVISEFYALDVHECQLLYSIKKGEYFLKWAPSTEGEMSNWEDDPPTTLTRLGSMSIGMYVDPAGTSKGITARASKTAIGIIGQDSLERTVLLWARVGYFTVGTMFDYIFEGCKKFEGLVGKVVVEANAMQTIIAPLLEKERRERNYYINPVPLPAKGDKTARIRMNVGRALMRGLVWVVEGEGKDFKEEKLIFPNNEYKMDTLDMFEKGLTDLTRPMSTEEEEEEEFEEELYWNEPTRSRVTGM